MNRRVIAAGVGGVAIVAASLGTAFAGQSHRTLHTWVFMFNAEQVASHVYTSQAISADKEVDGSGKLIGTDTVQCKFTSNSGADCDVAASYPGGQVYGEFTQGKDGKLSGKVTDGTRRYKGAVGTISGHAVNSTTTHVTVRFQTN